MDDSFQSVSAKSCDALCLETQTPVNVLIRSVKFVEFQCVGNVYSGHIATDLDLERMHFEASDKAQFIGFCKAHMGVYRAGTLRCNGFNGYYEGDGVFIVPALAHRDFTDLRCDPQITVVVFCANM